MADFGDLRYVLCRSRVGDGHGQTVRIDGGPFGVAVQLEVVVVCADGVLAQFGAEFGDGLAELVMNKKNYIFVIN